MFLAGVLYPVTEPERWCELYDLEIRKSPCMACGHELLMNVPFAAKDGIRGLTSLNCEICHDPRTPFIYLIKEK